MNAHYQNPRKFTLSDAFVSHSQMLLRAHKIDGSTSNIDIIFFNTAYVDIPFLMNGVHLSLCTHTNAVANEKIKSLLLKDRSLKLFIIKCNNEIFYVVAYKVSVFLNSLSLNQTSLGVFEPLGRDKEIFAI